MDIRQNIKNNQIAWGVGLSIALLLGIGSIIVIQQSSVLSLGSDSSSQGTSSKMPAKEREPVPENPGPPTQLKIVNGTITNINQDTKTLTVDNSVSTQHKELETIKVEISDNTNIVLYTAKSSDGKKQIDPETGELRLSTQTISFTDVRKEDQVTITLANPISKDYSIAKAERVEINGY